MCGEPDRCGDSDPTTPPGICELQTLAVATGDSLDSFGYQNGQLMTITDVNHDVTTIVRDGSGRPTKIVGAYQAENLLTVTGDYLTEVRDPASTATGEVVQRLDYDAWGSLTPDTAPSFQSLGYAGGLEDRDTRLVRLGARDYEPGTGRWTAPDPAGISTAELNSSAYVNQDPLDWIDPNGAFRLPSDPSRLPPRWESDPAHGGPYRHLGDMRGKTLEDPGPRKERNSAAKAAWKLLNYSSFRK